MTEEAAPEAVTETVTPDTDAPETTWQSEAGLVGDTTAEKYETVGDLFNAYKEASSMIGNSVRFPSKDAGDEAVVEFNQKMLDKGFYKAPNQDDADSVRSIQQLLGMPAEAQGYEFAAVEGFEDNAEDLGAFKALAHELGLTAKQAGGIHNWLGTSNAADDKAASEKMDAGMSELKGEWGQAFEHKMTGAKNAAGMLEERVPGISTYFDNMAEQGQDSNMIRLMDAVSEMLGESGASQVQPREVMTKAEAQARVREIQMNPDHPANNTSDPHHEEAARMRVALLKAAYG